MKYKTRLVIGFSVVLFGLTAVVAAHAQTSKGQRKTKARVQATKSQNKTNALAPAASASLSRDIVFDGSEIRGKYHSAGDALSIVENEKQMNELIGFRSDFKDRLSVERSRLKAGGDIGGSTNGQGQ